jgi:glycosyltransferase involved in cell wall biosynthesis
MNKSKRFKLIYFVAHPIQYQAPLLRLLANHPDIDLTVQFISDVSVTTFVDRGFKTKVTWDTPLLDGYDYHFLPCIRDKKTMRFFDPIVYGICKSIKKSKCDAVWFHGYAHYSLIIGMLCCVIKKIPIFFRAESNLVCTKRSFLKNIFISLLAKSVKAFLYIGSANKEYYQSYGVPEKKLFFVPYAVDNSYFKNKVNEQATFVSQEKKNLNLDPNLPVILYASKFIPRKNPLTLLHAFHRLSRNDARPPQAYLIYIGDGVQRVEVENTVNKLNLQSQVRLLGFKNQSQLPLYFSMCDIFVLASSREPFGLVINEVMNAGKMIIATNEVGASRDLIKENENGFVVEPDNIIQLHKALEKALADKETLHRMGQKSLEVIKHWGYQEDIEGIAAALHYC